MTEKENVLIIQDITLSWDKYEKNLRSSEMRSRFPKAFPIDISDMNGDFIALRYFYEQSDGGIYDRVYNITIGKRKSPEKIKPCFSADELDINNIAVSENDSGIDVTFFYDRRKNGLPPRRGHNKDFHNPDSRFCGLDTLNETAFVLKEGEKGRILYNERDITEYEALWCYNYRCINFAYIKRKNIGKNIFITDKYDYEYKQLAYLF